MENTEKPKLVNTQNNEWEFVYPYSMQKREIESTFYLGTEHLGRNNAFSEFMFQSLVDKHPYLFDAYSHLCYALRNQGRNADSFKVAEKGYRLGKSLLPETFDFKKDKILWNCIDNRGFLSVCHVLGLEYQHRKEYRKAIEIYDELVQCNDNDYQGVRDLLLECLFLLKDYKGAEEFVNKYADKKTIAFVYGKLIVEILKDNKDVKTLLDEAIKCNEFLPKEVIKTTHKASLAGAEDAAKEAFGYWSRNKELFENEKIINFFKKL